MLGYVIGGMLKSSFILRMADSFKDKITRTYIGPTLFLFDRIGDDILLEFGFQSGLASGDWPMPNVVIDYPLMKKRKYTFHAMIKNAPFMTHNPDGTARIISVAERMNGLWKLVGNVVSEGPFLLVTGQTIPSDYPVYVLRNVRLVAGIFDDKWSPPFKVAREEWLSWCKNNNVAWISLNINDVDRNAVSAIISLLKGVKVPELSRLKENGVDLYVPAELRQTEYHAKKEVIFTIAERLVDDAEIYAIRDEEKEENASREELFNVLTEKVNAVFT